jgi:hypothetical protein
LAYANASFHHASAYWHGAIKTYLLLAPTYILTMQGTLYSVIRS